MFTVEKKELADVVVGLAAILSKNPTHAILRYLLVKIADGELEVSATNLTVSISRKIKCQHNKGETRQVALPGIIFKTLLGKITADAINFDIEDNTFKYSEDGVSLSLKGVEATEYVELPFFKANGVELFPIAPSVILNAIDFTSEFTSADDSKQILTGINFCFEENRILAYATDGHMMVRHISCSDNDEIFSFILPSYGARILRNMIKSEKNDIILINKDFPDNLFICKTRNMTYMCRILDGVYPKCESLLFDKAEIEFDLDPSNLAEGIDLMSVFPVDYKSSPLVEVTIENDYLTLDTESTMGKLSKKIEIHKQDTHKNMALTFNTNFLSKGLGKFKGHHARVLVNASNKPVIFQVDGESKQTFLVMPIDKK